MCFYLLMRKNDSEVITADSDMIVAVVGCMTQQTNYDTLLREKYAFVDIILGTRNLEDLKIAIENLKASREIQKKGEK